MIVKPTVSELLEKVNDNRYSLVIMTAKRARQISNGDKVRVKSKDRSAVTLAATEIAEGKVSKVDEDNLEIQEVNDAEEKNEEE